MINSLVCSWTKSLIPRIALVKLSPSKHPCQMDRTSSPPVVPFATRISKYRIPAFNCSYNDRFCVRPAALNGFHIEIVPDPESCDPGNTISRNVNVGMMGGDDFTVAAAVISWTSNSIHCAVLPVLWYVQYNVRLGIQQLICKQLHNTLESGVSNLAKKSRLALGTTIATGTYYRKYYCTVERVDFTKL